MAETILDIKTFGGLNFGPHATPQECAVCLNLDDTNAPALRTARSLAELPVSGDGELQGIWIEEGTVLATVRDNTLYFGEKTFSLTDCGKPRRFLRISPSAVLILPDRYLLYPKTSRVRPFDNEFTVRGTVESVIGDGVRLLLESKPENLILDKVYVSNLDHSYYDEETNPNAKLLCFNLSYAETLNNGKCRLHLSAVWRDGEGELGYINTGVTRDFTVRLVLPALTDATLCRNRLWGIAGKKLVASKLGDPFTFDDFSGLSTDSFELSMENTLTAVSHFGERVVFMTKNALYELYGDRPSNYQVSAAKPGGCSFPESVCTADGYLVYAGTDRLYRYGGSAPQPICDALEFPVWSRAFGVSNGNTCYLGLDERLFCYRPSGNRFFELPFSASGGFEADGDRYFFNAQTCARVLRTRSEQPYHYRSGRCCLSRLGNNAPKELFIRMDGARPTVSLTTPDDTYPLTACEDRGDGILRYPFPADLTRRIFSVDIQGEGDACIHRITIRG